MSTKDTSWERDKKYLQRMFATYVGCDMAALMKEAIDESLHPLLINNLSELGL